ncbi:hypothetical protein DSM106972_074670 [Dulcicalothrix desertica PCC 7102]|uniref:Uncharacterized protein n=1 Tax=Dulcicalothrix desertica PCC 7102 TaxID=232991 RepID=A0A3S1IPQ3_9CYAN|nr:hypothetical protein [Dulcicalothrix desertica]RUT00339.1 hypothetical protein DSM106972_074670 [Dulcicalothrix desertica PCC 7102]
MTETKLIRTVCRGKIFPEIQWTEEQKDKQQAEREAFKARCKPIFDWLKLQYIQTH